MQLIKKFYQEDEAIETMEYALVGGLIAVAAIVGMGLLGTTINNWMTAIAGKIAMP